MVACPAMRMMRAMRSILRNTYLLLCFLAPLSAGGSPAPAQEQTLSIEQPRARINIPGRPAAGYMTIVNSGQSADALVAATTPLAKRVELHTHLMEGGIMKMREVEKVDVPAYGKAVFSSGGDHLMFFGLAEDVQPGGTLPVTLNFQSGKTIDVDFTVTKIGGQNRSAKGTGQQHHHKN